MTSYMLFVPRGVELTNDEYLSQVEWAGEKAAREGVILALTVLSDADPDEITMTTQLCLDYLSTFGNWQAFQLPKLWMDHLRSENGEEGEDE